MFFFGLNSCKVIFFIDRIVEDENNGGEKLDFVLGDFYFFCFSILENASIFICLNFNFESYLSCQNRWRKLFICMQIFNDYVQFQLIAKCGILWILKLIYYFEGMLDRKL